MTESMAPDFSALLRLQQQTAAGGSSININRRSVSPQTHNAASDSDAASAARADSLNILRLKAREHELKLEMLKRMES
jgi:hypothetical protein